MESVGTLTALRKELRDAPSEHAAPGGTLDAPTGPEEKGLSLSWAVVLLASIVGLLVTLSPSKRTTEIKGLDD